MNTNKENLTSKLEKMRFNITQVDRDKMYNHLSKRLLIENNRRLICDCLKVIYELSEDSKQKEIILDATYMATRMSQTIHQYRKHAEAGCQLLHAKKNPERVEG
jgi:hypothetical protein